MDVLNFLLLLPRRGYSSSLGCRAGPFAKQVLDEHIDCIRNCTRYSAMHLLIVRHAANSEIKGRPDSLACG